MKRLLFTLLMTAAAIAALSSCSTTAYVSAEDEANRAWVGRPYSELIDAYGAPMRETSDGKGGKIVIYEKSKSEVHTRAYAEPWFGYYARPYTSYDTETVNTTDYAHFYLDEKEVCYKVRTNLQKENGTVFDPAATAGAVGGGVAALLMLILMIAR